MPASGLTNLMDFEKQLME